jgi:hypothetical protein
MKKPQMLSEIDHTTTTKERIGHGKELDVSHSSSVILLLVNSLLGGR